jgi:hypothetical protein
MSATTPKAAPAVKLSAEDFMHHMASMQAHYSPGGGGMHPAARAYALPPHVVQLLALHRAAPAAPVHSAGQAAVALILHEAEQDTLSFVNAHHDGLKVALATTRQTAETARFVEQMQRLEQQEIADHAARIQKLFAALIAAGHAHPGQQPHILMATNGAGAFLAGLLHEAHAATHGIVGLFGGAAHATAAAVHKAAEAAGHWASGAVQSVGHFFKSLF